MKIMLLEWNGYGYLETIDALKEMGHEIIHVDFPSDEARHNDEFEHRLECKIADKNPDIVFSFNFFPVIALVCKKTQTKYVSWVYDCPFIMLYSYTIIFPTNYIFLFDKEQYLEFHNNGINTVYYLPLACDAKRMTNMKGFEEFLKSPDCNKTDISFVGQLYTEKHQFYNRMTNLDSYTKGYLEGIMSAQQKVYGYNFIKELLTPDIIDSLYKALPMDPNPEGVETREYLYSQYIINRQITAIERTKFLNAIGEKYAYDLYTHNTDLKMKNCVLHGKIDPVDTAPFVFRNSKINLNISLRSITSGIPLRCFEIMGAGGFLLTNYQADFDDCYVAGEDYVYFESIEDMMGKIEYYLSHEKERADIAQNGYRRTLNEHSYVLRWQEMIDVATQSS